MDDQESTAPASTPVPHDLDLVVPEIAKLFRDILKYRVDPAGEYYGITEPHLLNAIRGLVNNNVYAIEPEKNDFKFQEKGHMFDPFLQSFIQGSGGQITTWSRVEHSRTPVVLRGITKRKEMQACRQADRDFYYIDTGYFGNGKKKTFHRITKNDVQNFGPIRERPSDRLAQTGVQFTKFRRDGSRILLAPPSQKLLNLYNINLEEWLYKVKTELAQYTDREVVTRLKQGRSVRQSVDTMEMALQQDIWCLVTFSSIAAGEALLCGKPAITLGPNAAAPLCSQSLSEIENPKIPSLDEVAAWARHLSYCQFTEPEMRNGTAWRILND